MTSQKTYLVVATIDDLISTGIPTHSIHVWYIYLHFPHKSTKCSKYTSPMDGLGKVIFYGKPSNENDHFLRNPQPSRVQKIIVQIQPETFQILFMKSSCIFNG